MPITPELKTYTSKSHVVTFMPYMDPFAKSRFEISNEIPFARKLPAEPMPLVNPIPSPPLAPTPGGRPLLRLTTVNLPPSPTLAPKPALQLVPPPQTNPGVEKSAVILDGTGRIMAKLKVVTSKTKFVPGDEMNVTIILTLPKGVSIPKYYNAKIIERRTLGFETDEDADLVETGSDNAEKPSRKTSSGKIFKRILSTCKNPFPRTSVSFENRPMTGSSHNDNLPGGYSLDAGQEVTETISVRLPSFKTFIDDSLLPSASLPLGPCSKDTSFASLTLSPSSTITPISLKGKEPMRPISAHRPLTSTTMTSSKSGSSVIEGLHYIVAHSLNVTVPLSSGLIRKSSGILNVDLDIILGNKTPDIYSYQPHSFHGSVEVLKVSTPELVIVPPEQQLQEFSSGGLGVPLRDQDSRNSFRREPSPLRNMDGYDGAADGRGGSSIGMSNGIGGVGRYARSLRPSSSKVSFTSLELPKWRKGEKFPTLEDSEERPCFLMS